MNDALIRQVELAHARNIRDADNLASRPKIFAVKATSRAVLVKRDAQTISLNDILESAQATGILLDPVWKNKLLAASSMLNSPIIR